MSVDKQDKEHSPPKAVNIHLGFRASPLGTGYRRLHACTYMCNNLKPQRSAVRCSVHAHPKMLATGYAPLRCEADGLKWHTST
jgi:hypothetical protein